jgi:hypothetical protein
MELGDVIATRTLDVVDATGHPVGTLTVSFGRPTQEPTGEWLCPYKIGPDRPFGALGLDAVQALELAMRLVGARLAAMPEAREGRLRLAGETNLGFPSQTEGHPPDLGTSAE